MKDYSFWADFLSKFDTSSMGVKIAILMSITALVLTPLYILLRYSQSRRDFPSDTLFAMRRDGDMLTINIHKKAGMGAHQLNNLLEISGLLELNPPDAPKEETEQEEEKKFTPLERGVDA